MSISHLSYSNRSISVQFLHCCIHCVESRLIVTYIQNHFHLLSTAVWKSEFFKTAYRTFLGCRENHIFRNMEFSVGILIQSTKCLTCDCRVYCIIGLFLIVRNHHRNIGRMMTACDVVDLLVRTVWAYNHRLVILNNASLLASDVSNGVSQNAMVR